MAKVADSLANTASQGVANFGELPSNRYSEQVLSILADRTLQTLGRFRGIDPKLGKVEKAIEMARRYLRYGDTRLREQLIFSSLGVLFYFGGAIANTIEPWLTGLNNLLLFYGIVSLYMFFGQLAGVVPRGFKSKLAKAMDTAWAFEKLQSADEILSIHRHAVWPFSLVYMGAQSKGLPNLVRLLSCNLDWYLVPPRPLLKLSWLGDICGLLLYCCSLSVVFLFSDSVLPTDPIFLIVAWLCGALWTWPRNFEASRKRIFTSHLMVYFAERLHLALERQASTNEVAETHPQFKTQAPPAEASSLPSAAVSGSASDGTVDLVSPVAGSTSSTA